MIIPHQQLSKDALRGIIEEFISRDNDIDLSLEESSDKIKKLLDNGDLVVVYDEESESCSILPIRDAQALMI